MTIALLSEKCMSKGGKIGLSLLLGTLFLIFFVTPIVYVATLKPKPNSISIGVTK